MVSTDRSPAGKRADRPAMVQPEWDQAKHILQSAEKSSGTISGFYTGARSIERTAAEFRDSHREKWASDLAAGRHLTGNTAGSGT